MYERETVTIKELGPYVFSITYRDEEYEITTKDVGYSLLRAKLPAIKAAHGIAKRIAQSGLTLEEYRLLP